MTRSAPDPASAGRHPARWIAPLILGYLFGGLLLHHVVFPAPFIPDEFQPRTGDAVHNAHAREQVRITTASTDSDGAYTEIEVRLQAGGAIPLAHRHPGAKETFTVVQGQGLFLLDGARKTLNPGQSVTVPPGTSHQVRNASKNELVFTARIQPPGRMGLCLIQIHGYLGEHPEHPRGWLESRMQMMTLANACEVYLGGWPILLQRIFVFLAEPSLRLLGFRPFEVRYARQARTHAQTTTP